ncbi:FAD binding domain-containing protein [Penicillium odoratum]|uniref:FAD binding domain-containing protein n=1 Tax=Penicillium odoratum TaxID=1167516 RepID=UPI002549002C|nr:FAD binding domain-containing protein [Penicillium odoratum]KAJ5777235.1 FAD binding domain-containing protein [Penicillium odoratum]
MNHNQDLLRSIIPDESRLFWRNYPRLLEIKKKYDQNFVLYGPASVGSEHWKIASDGRLCRAGA